MYLTFQKRMLCQKSKEVFLVKEKQNNRLMERDWTSILAVKIQNRKTKEFYCKGGGFGKKGKAWTTLGYAKTAVYPKCYWLDHQKKSFIERYKEELNSDFLVITDKGTYTIPVASYFVDYLTREHELDIVSNIKKYCKKNNINLESEETNDKNNKKG